MLRHAADWRTLFFLCLFAALSIGGWVVDPPWYLAVPWIAATMWMSFTAAVIAHNTVHCPVFKKRWMNKVFQVWVSLSYGFPVSVYVPGHNLSHHKFTQRAEDVMRTTKLRYRWNLLNVLLFALHVQPAIIDGNNRYNALMKKRLPAWYRQLMVENAAVWGVKAVLLVIDWRKALLYYIVPHLFAVWGIAGINFLQHDGCDAEHPVNHSRNFMGRFINWLLLNNGYHGIHHETPGLHWSLTPAAHAQQYHPTIHPALEQKSLFGYIFRAFIYPGKRLTYDGKPVVVAEVEADRDWVAATRGFDPAELGAAGSGG